MKAAHYLKILIASLLIGANAHSQKLNEMTIPFQTDGGLFKTFLGQYTVKLNINGNEFLDQLVITSVTNQSGSFNLKENFEGTFTVPGVFTSAVEEGLLQYGLWSGEIYLSFKITAIENGNSFPVYFRAQGGSINQACVLTGKAYSPDPETEMGSFTMTKDADECVGEK
jgi:hypothetical protein